MADRIVSLLAVLLSVIGVLALSIVVIMSLARAGTSAFSRSDTSAFLTWVGMIALPLALILLIILCVRAIMYRRRS